MEVAILWLSVTSYDGSITRSWTWEIGEPFLSFVSSLSSSYDIGSNLSGIFFPYTCMNRHGFILPLGDAI